MMLAKYNDETVGRAPWPAADPPVGPLERSKSRTSLCCIAGQVGNLRRVATRLPKLPTRAVERRLPTGAEDNFRRASRYLGDSNLRAEGAPRQCH